LCPLNSWIAPVRPGIEFQVRRGEMVNVLHIDGPGYSDTVLLSPTPLTYEGEGVRFEGRVGVVRRTRGDVQAMLLDGQRIEAK